MGQAKERKARLGKWYGHPIGPGHPDFVPPKKPEPIRPLLRFDFSGDVMRVLGSRIDDFSVNGERIEVGFVDGKRDAFWPSLEDGNVRGDLTIGSREFGNVELAHYTETGCVFLRSQPTQEETSKSEPIEAPSDERRTREESNVLPQRSVRTIPNRRRLPFIVSALAVVMVGMSSIPEPEYRPKKR